MFEALDADFFCLQETKLQEGQIELDLPGYHQYWNYAEKKGYSGTAIFAKEPALSVRYGLGIEEHDTEGRVITLEYPEFFLITCYTPNSQNELRRLDYRMTWEDAFLAYLTELKQQKPVILCGDLNVAHKNIDIKNWKTNQKMLGLHLKNGKSFRLFWLLALPIRSVISIQMQKAFILGGATVSTLAKTMPAGASITLSFRMT